MTIPIYKNSKTKYWTNSWKYLNSFDILSSEQVYQNYYNTYEELKSFSFEKSIKIKNFSNIRIFNISEFVNKWNGLHEGGVVDIAKRHWENNPDDKFLYVEIPYQFFEDHMTDWLEDEFDIPLSRIKKCIKRGDMWSTHIGNAGKTMPQAFSFLNYFTFDYYGVANPIFNNGQRYPKRSTHITAFTSIIKSDVPILFQINGDSSKFKIVPNKMELPYFNKSYLTMEVDMENKSINFFLDDTKHIGVYKYETKV